MHLTLRTAARRPPWCLTLADPGVLRTTLITSRTWSRQLHPCSPSQVRAVSLAPSDEVRDRRRWAVRRDLRHRGRCRHGWQFVAARPVHVDAGIRPLQFKESTRLWMLIEAGSDATRSGVNYLALQVDLQSKIHGKGCSVMTWSVLSSYDNH